MFPNLNLNLFLKIINIKMILFYPNLIYLLLVLVKIINTHFFYEE